MKQQSDLIETQVENTDQSRFEILVVEDDEIQSRLLREFLEILRYSVREAPTCADALRLIHERRPDLTLLDVHLPDGSGLDLVQQIHLIDKDASVVLMSADRTAEMLVESLAKGAEEFLEKPLDLGELAIRIQNLLQTVALRKKSEELQAELAREKEILTRYFSAETVTSILTGEMEADASGQTGVATILIFDLRNSTGLAEIMGAIPFAELLNSLMIALMDLIFEKNGSIAKLTGDGLVATFLPGQACAAISCAQSVAQYFQSIAQESSSEPARKLGFGIGIATGKVFQGNVGTFRRLEWTIVGDAVARAARLESLTKKLGCSILIDRPTMRGCGSQETSAREKRVLIKGRKATLYTLAD